MFVDPPKMCSSDLCYTDTSLKPLSCIRYVSDTDTCPICPGYVSSEYPLFYYFCDNRIRHRIRILLPDTARPSRSPGRQTLSSAPTPAVRSPAVPHGDELTAAPVRLATTLLAGRRPPAMSLRLRLRSPLPWRPATWIHELIPFPLLLHLLVA